MFSKVNIFLLPPLILVQQTIKQAVQNFSSILQLQVDPQTL